MLNYSISPTLDITRWIPEGAVESEISHLVLTRGYLGVVDTRDFDYANQWKWRAVVQTRQGVSYVKVQHTMQIGPKGRKDDLHLHRVIWERHNGPIPEGMTIDHINHGEHGALDNRLCNLRLATRHEQQLNRRPTGKSGYKGVSQSGRRWTASLCGKYIGSFGTKEEAAYAYDAAVYRRYGEFAFLNFPNNKWMYQAGINTPMLKGNFLLDEGTRLV